MFVIETSGTVAGTKVYQYVDGRRLIVGGFQKLLIDANKGVVLVMESGGDKWIPLHQFAKTAPKGEATTGKRIDIDEKEDQTPADGVPDIEVL
jgi:hypothetical protein